MRYNQHSRLLVVDLSTIPVHFNSSEFPAWRKGGGPQNTRNPGGDQPRKEVQGQQMLTSATALARYSRQTKVETYSSRSRQPRVATYATNPGADQPSKEVQRLVTALVTCRPAAVMTQCHLPTSARYSDNSSTLFKNLSEETKMSTLHSIHQTLSGVPFIKKSPSNPSMILQDVKKPSIFQPGGVSVPSSLHCCSVLPHCFRRHLHEGPVYQLQSAVLTKRHSF